LAKSLEKRTLESSMAGAALFILSFIQNILLVPMFLKFWGAEKYGIWISIFAFASLLKTLDTGHQNYVGNEFNKAFFSDINLAKKILGSAFFIAILLGIFEIIVYCIFAWGIADPQTVGLSSNITTNNNLRYSLLFFLLVWGVSGSVGGLLVRIILPLGIYAKTTVFSLIYKIGEIIILLFAILGKWDISNLCFFYALITGIYNLLLFFYVKKVLPSYFPWWQSISWGYGIKNFTRSLVLTANGFIEQFNSSGIVLLVSKQMGILFVPIFTTIRTVTNMVLQITNLVTNPLAPEIIMYHSKGENRKIILLFETNWFIAGLIVNIPFILLAPFIEKLYTLWVKHALVFDIKLYYLLTLSVAFVNFGRSYVTYLTSTNSLFSMMIITVSRFSLTIGLSFILLPYYHLIGIGIAILVAEMISSFILPLILVTFQMDKIIKFSIGEFQIFGLGQIMVLSIYYLVSYIFPHAFYFIFLFSITIMFLLSYLQWKSLNIEIKIRFKELSMNIKGKIGDIIFFKSQ
jgi:O-antigen/teichoic acid export membrane protein